MIILADSPEQEVAGLRARTLRFAADHGARNVESELYEYGDGNTVKCIVVERAVRGRLTMYTFWEANGRRVGINELLGILNGRCRWPPKRKFAPHGK